LLPDRRVDDVMPRSKAFEPVAAWISDRHAAYPRTRHNWAENTIRTAVTGRKNYYGSGSIWSAQLAATLFAILQTLGLWGINPRHWLRCYLSACAQNGASPPTDIDPFLPWAMDETRRAALSRPYPCRAPPAEPPPIRERA